MNNNSLLAGNIINHRTEQSRSNFRQAVSDPFKGVSFLIVTFALLILSSARVRASDPIGIYALVDKVVLEPNETSPERIQIWGAFALAEGNGDAYKSAERGYLYYKLVPEKANICRNEWSDLKAVAGSGQIVSFAARYQEKGALRKAGVKPENPDKYPVAMGVHKVQADRNYGPIKSLVELRDSQRTKDKAAASKN